MTRFLPRAAPCRAAGVLAATGLLAALAGPAPALAAGPPVLTPGGPAETVLHPYPESGEPRPATLGITVGGPGRDGADGGFTGEFSLTFDLGALAGVAEAAAGEDADCEITGTTAVCRGTAGPSGPRAAGALRLTAAEGSAAGDTATVTVTGRAKGAVIAPFTTRVTVGGPDLVMEELPFETRTEPGDRQQAPITFTNRGSLAADGVLLGLVYSRGLDIPQRYANCAYTVDGPDLPDAGRTTVLCSVPGSFEAGGTYTLTAPLTVETTGRALYDTFVYRIDEAGAVPGTGVPLTRGTGRVLGAAPVKRPAGTRPAAARSADPTPGDNQHEARFRTRNTADFTAYGAALSGAAGSTVTATVGFRNEGPAWVGGLRPGGPVAAVDLTVPPGATVTAEPDGCRAVAADGGGPDRTGPARRYVCATPPAVLDGGGLDLRFELRIDRVVAGASGTVTVRRPGPGALGLPFDPEPGNNTARLVLNGGGGGDRGATGGPGVPSAGPATARTPAPEAGPPGPPAAPGGGTGALAATGSSALTVSGAAAVALAAGLLLVTAARRRDARKS